MTVLNDVIVEIDVVPEAVIVEYMSTGVTDVIVE